MHAQFEHIRVLIWDFDGTLYKPQKALFGAVREAEYKTIMIHTGWDHEKTVAEFEKNYKHVTPSATETVGMLTHMSTTEAALEMEKYYDRRQFLQKDPQLIALFAALKNFTHYILANGIRHRLEETLKVLGLDKHIFTEIVTSEIVGKNKPHDDGFRYILKKTGLPPDEHMMIGDREAVDLAPAKHLNMKTCLVWSETKSTVADVTVPTVYDVKNVVV